MDIFTSFYQLVNIIAGLHLMKTLTSANKIRKRLIVTDVEHYINIFFVFKIAIKADNILIEKGPMNFYFACQLLSCLSPSKISFWNNFQSPCLCFILFTLDWLKTTDFVTFRKTSFA